MKYLSNKLIGKTLKGIERFPDSISLSFFDGSGMTIYTSIICNIKSSMAPARVISCENIDNDLVLTFFDGSDITVLIKDELISSPEIFIFYDVDGSTIVESA